MEKVRYMISDAAAAVEVETHVLRYWEDELGLEVPRNELGHRYYTRDNIQQFLRIKELKEQGYQLRAIRGMIHEQTRGESVEGNSDSASYQTTNTVYPQRTSEIRLEEFKELMNGIVGKAIALNNEELSIQISKEVEERILKEMNYLMREQDNQQEERYKKLDMAIRNSIRKKSFIFKKREKKTRQDKLKPVHAVE